MPELDQESSATEEETPNVEETLESNPAGDIESDSPEAESAPDQDKVDAIGEGDSVSVKEKEGQAEGDVKKYMVKVDGEEIEVTEEELLRGYQLRKASDKRFEEAAELRKMAQTFLDLLKNDPKKALRHPDLGIDLRSLAEEMLNEYLEEEMLSPEEKRIRELERELAAKKDGEEKKKRDSQAQQLQEEQAKLVEDWGKELDGVIKESGLPDTDFVYKRFLDYKEQSVNRDVDMSFKDFVGWVKEDLQNEFSSVLKGISPSQLAELFGEDTLKQIREFDIQRLKSPAPKTPNPEDQGKPREKKRVKTAPKMTWKEMMEKRRQEWAKD